MIAIVDYGVGNLSSLRRSLEAVGADVTVTDDIHVLESADKIVLPGVGAFRDAARRLRESGLGDTIVSLAKDGKPLLGICLGMQLLFDESREYGVHKGLGLIHGSIVPISDVIPAGLKIPHIGWNSLTFTKESPLFSDTPDGSYVYFVHSYYAADCDCSVIATTEYRAPLTAAVQEGNIFGCQFHPEKSGDVGLGILRSFCEMR